MLLASLDAHLVPEARDEEEGGGEEEDHERRAGLALPQASVDDHLVEPPQLGGQGLVLTLKGLDLVLQRVYSVSSIYYS